MLLPMETLYDMHCHLGFTPSPSLAAADAEQRDIGAFSCTVTPEEFEALAPQLADSPNVCVGLGAHPWWIADGRISDAQLDTFCALAPTTAFIGEIGLDFAGPRDTPESRQWQNAAFARILAVCNEAVPQKSDATTTQESSLSSACLPKLISIHAVNAASEVLDALEAADTLSRHQAIFHWFSGSSDDLQRALRTGCFFSVGPRMLASRRGREYARQIPLDRLLLETDMPARDGETLPANVWEAELRNALTGIAQLKGIDPADLSRQLAATSETLLTRIICDPNLLPGKPRR